jgi:endonuclease/exonuclease/phosphatase family metal-dependent hydrolase
MCATPPRWDVRTRHQPRARDGSHRRTSAGVLAVALPLLIALSLLLVPSAHALVVNPASPVTVGQQVTFSESAGAFCCTWSFGDGKTGSGRSTAHTFTAPGTYTVRASGFYLNPITKGPGASFTTTATVVAKNPLDTSPPEASVHLSGAVAQPSIATASTAGDSGRITGVDDDATLSWSARGGDPQSGVKDVKLHITTTSYCRDVIAQRTTVASFTDTYVGAPTAGTTSYAHPVGQRLNDILRNAGVRCASTFNFDYAIITARAEIANGVGAKTLTQTLRVRYDPRLRVIAYNLGGGTDKNDSQEADENIELEGLKQRVGDADIALLQEVRKTWCNLPPFCSGPLSSQYSLVDQGQLIADATELKHFAWNPQPVNATGTRDWTAGPAIFSRYPLRNPRYIPRGDGTDGAVVAEATINGVPHLLITVHYPLYYEVFNGPGLQQAVGDKIAKAAREFRGPVIIGGDFNNEPGNAQLDTFLHDPLAVPAPTFADARWNGQTKPFFPKNSFDDAGDGCKLDPSNIDMIDHIFWRGSTQGTPDYPTYASVAQHRNYRHLTYEARCSPRPNSNHPLILARLR